MSEKYWLGKTELTPSGKRTGKKHSGNFGGSAFSGERSAQIFNPEVMGWIFMVVTSYTTGTIGNHQIPKTIWLRLCRDVNFYSRKSSCPCDLW
jgi:hypothetical protein